MTLRHLGLILAFVGAISACGPEQSARDQEQDQIREHSDRQKATNDTLAGKYVGTLIGITGEKLKVVLNIASVTILEVMPGRNETVEVPTLAGSLSSYKVKEGDGNVIQIYVRSLYREDTRTLRLFSTNTRRDNSDAPAVYSGMVIQEINGRWSGQVLAPMGISTIDLVKVN